MNFIKSIFIIYLLFITVKPCVDEYSITLYSETKFSQMETHDDSGCCDECSPSCVCICCNSIVDKQSSYIAFTGLPLTDFLPLQDYSQITQSDVSVWRPPKV